MATGADHGLIELGDVTKRYAGDGVAALDNVGLRVAAGEAVAVMGHRGAVSRTLSNLIAGLDRPLVVGATTSQNGAVVAGQALVRRLTVLVIALAALGVLSAATMLARRRVHDLGVCKAIGMTPRQIIVTIVSWMIAPAVVAAVIALP